MSATLEATVRARIPQRVKKDTDAIFKRLGLSRSEAIRMFFQQVQQRRALPFAPPLPPEDNSDILLPPHMQQAIMDMIHDD